MKTTADPDRGQDADLRPEYQFNYGEAKPNRFAGKIDMRRVVVVLDPDVAEVFTTPESVNTMLRAIIQKMPTAKRRRVEKTTL